MSTSPRAGSHGFEEHVGEVRVRLEAPTLAELYVEAGRAFAELVAGDALVATGPARRVVVRGRDREGLLVALLDELVFQADEGRVYPELEIVRIGDRELEASLREAPGAAPRLPVKAATFHDLAIHETRAGLAATVVLDV